MERMLQEAVAGMSQQEQEALRQMGNGVAMKGAFSALRAGMDEQLNRLAAAFDSQHTKCHMRVVKP